ncbi:hypothetical protein LIER_19965 [Lithospermum erythrorhizon]|uniref:Uncharacterized protein n=1 Tax=Lithospermum erythrorhizon TaxID=34254 RepID=A0AAV3QL84_LITER
MPGNESGDRLHNFFLQDNSSPVQQHQQIADGAWSVVNNNLWVGSPPQFGVSSANTKNYNLQHSDTDRGQSSHALHGPHGLNFTQTRSNFAGHPSQNQQLNSNAHTFGSRVNQTRQDEGNISSVNTVPDQHNFVSRGLSMYESHQGFVHQHQPLVRSGTSESPVSFDLFGNQQQMYNPQSSMLHLHRQQSGFGDMNPLQQQIILRKMQELQMQQQVRQMDNRQLNALNSVSSFPKQSSGSYPSALGNSSPNSDSGNNLWAAGIGSMNWQQHASPVLQGSSNGLVFSSNDGQAQRLMDFVPQQSDQSLYGVPVSGSRANVTQFQQMAAEKPLAQQMVTLTNSVPGNQYTSFSEHAGMLDQSLVSIKRFPGESSYERPDLTIQQDNTVQRISSSQEIHQEESNSQSKVAISQNEVSLDPTEERILFGSDDNIFAEFAKNPDFSGDGGGPFDTFQSGSWSALMQSAVAETSDSEIGKQDELCGMRSLNTSIHPTYQQSAYSGRQDMSFNSDMPPSQNISAPSPDNNRKNTDYQNVLGGQKLGNKLGFEHGQQLQSSSSQRETRNLSNALETESNMKNIPGPWASTQSGMSRAYGIPNGWNTSGSVVPAACELDNHQRENLSNCSQGYEQKKELEGGVRGMLLWNSSSMPHSSVDTGHAKSVGSPNLSNTRFYDEASQGNYWRNVNPLVKSYGGENMEGSHHHINRDNQNVDSSFNSMNKAEFNSSQQETPKRKGNSKDGHTANFSGNSSAGCMKETGLSDVSDSHSLPSRNQKLVDQIGGWKTSSPPKFQFHPMGNLEEEVGPQYGMKQSFSGKVNTTQIPESSGEMKKGHLADPNDAKDISNTVGNFLDHIDNVKDTYSSQNMLELLEKVDQSRDHGPMMHTSPSHNISSEKHESDNSGSAVSHLQRSQSSNSQGFGLQLGPPSHRTTVSNQQFLSQRNLQTVASLHQIQAAPEIVEKGQLQLPASPSGHSLPSADERIPGEFKRNRSGLAEQAINNAFMHKLQGNLSSASNTYSSQFQHLQHMARTSGKVSTNQYDGRNVQHDNSDALAVESHQIGTANQHSMGWVPPSAAKEPISVPLPVSLSGNARQGPSLTMPPNIWNNVSGLPNMFSAQTQKTAPNVRQSYQANVLESSSSAPCREAEQDAVTDCNSPSVSGASSMNRDSPAQKDSTKNLNYEKDGYQGTEPVSFNPTDGSSARTAITQKNIEAFGRSLVSNSLSHQQFSLLNQMQAMKTAEPDTNGRALKKMKGLEGIVEGPKLTPNAASRNAGLQSLASSGYSGVLNFSGLADNAERETSAQSGNVSSQNIIAPGQEDFRTNLHGNNTTSPRVDQPHISPQMPPSWFNHYGTFRNGQMLAINDNFQGKIPKTAEQPSTLGKSSTGLHTLNSMEQVPAAVDPGQHLNIPQSSTNLTASMEPQSIQLSVSRLKKRKRQTFFYISWHKEVSHKLRTAKTIRMAEEVWAKAVNRKPEKIEDEVDLSENGPTTLKAKRRLNLTTHLMQQLLCPPIPIILSSDAELAHEGVVYSVSRLALGEACGLIPHLSSNSGTSHDGEKLSSDKKSEKVNDRHLPMVMKDFRGRALNLETEFFR